MASPPLRILIVGTSGQGKSTLANVLTETNRFQESEFSVPQTSQYQIESVSLESQHLTVVDTIGLLDTRMAPKQIFEDLAKACHALTDGFHQLLFVIKGRFTKEQIQAFELLANNLFPTDILGKITIVRTSFPSFMNPDRCAEDVALLKAENPQLRQIMERCPMIHVENPSLLHGHAGECRRNSHLKLMVHLRATTTTAVHPLPWATLRPKIDGYMTSEELAAKQKQELKEREEQQKREAEARRLQAEANARILAEETRRNEEVKRAQAAALAAQRAAQEEARKNEEIKRAAALAVGGWSRVCTTCGVIATFQAGHLTFCGNATVHAMVPNQIFCTHHPALTHTV